MVQQIVTKGYEYCVPKERAAGAAITPGMLVEIDAAGDIVPHATAAQENAAVRVLYNAEDWGQDKTEDTPAGDQGKYVTAHAGVEVEVILAASQTVADGDKLVSNGDGTVRALNTGNTGETVAATLGEVVPGVGEGPGVSHTTGTGETARITMEVTQP